MASIIYQDYGTSILLFVKGTNEQDAYGKWLSLFNWNATSSEANFVAPNTIACWSTNQKFMRYLFNIHEHRILNNKPSKGLMDDAALAFSRAQAEFAATPRESFRSVNSAVLPFEMGEIGAEEPDDDISGEFFRHFSHRE